MAQNDNPRGLAFAFRALRARNYKLFFAGQTTSLIGTWMTRLALSWLVYRLTKNAFLLGFVSFAGQIPGLVLGPFAGVWVDRWNRHHTLVWTQVLSMVQSFMLAGLTLSGHLQRVSGAVGMWEIILLSLLQGAINSFDMPARQAFVVEMIEDRDDLPNAIALNSSMVNASRLVGPSIAGAVIAATNEGWCFFIDGVSYIAVIVSLLMMHVAHRERAARRANVREEWFEGWRYVSSFLPMRMVLLLMALVSLVGFPYTVLMPIYASDILHGGAHTLGILMGAVGTGALISAGALAFRRSVVGLGRVIPMTAGLFGAALIAFAYSRSLWLSLPLLVLTGFGMMQQMAASNTVLQTIVEEDKRGRVMSFYSMAFMGVAPFGSLAAGIAARHIGAPLTLAIGGGLCIVGAAWFSTNLKAIRDHVRPIYRRLGILPEIASGIQAASALQRPPE